MPKRSHGCFECRKRKVRCDETKPECNTCLRRGTKCPGYRPAHAFVVHTFDRNRGRIDVREDEDRYRYANRNHPSDNQAVVQARPSESTPVDGPVPRPVNQAAIDRVQFLSSFLSLYLPSWKGEILTPPAAMMFYLPTVPASRQVFSAALDAVSMAQLAVDNKNYPLIYRTRSTYGTALSHLMRAISHPEHSLTDETLLATYLLGLYEVFVGVTGMSGFYYHVQGLLHLLRLRGPSGIKTPLALDVFHGVRYNWLSVGYRLRRASILDSPEWLAVTANAAKTDPYVALIDICIGIPRILERTDQLAKSAASVEEFDKLIDDSQQLADRAFAWFAKFESNGPLYTKVPIDQMDGFLTYFNDHTYDPVYHFKTFAIFTTLINYWMAMSILRSNTFGLVRRFRQLAPKQLLMWDRELSSYADNICRAVPYGVRRSAGYCGRFGTLTPLVVARKYYEAKKAAKEMAWCDKVFVGARVPGLYTPPSSKAHGTTSDGQGQSRPGGAVMKA
ncbi:uncharacterized protein EI97DRAFT_308006 [Westerdykella ornata]|uniref:Zn(2)-C6 fungal-type domain-containing protein n=1 Tax=Westerdykella ornata TaxID=318751 RepID=A0A6A6JLD2_WESOR|nr:uncharacterized protein EI97DRAFT_308006 [Westerdykella ornata]KAF2277064.1 hypothetical protein EI97DRAFT_308006 [Westerdykella ornata]